MRFLDGVVVGSRTHLFAFAQIAGLVGSGPAAGLSDPVVLTMTTDVDLSGGFTVEAGGCVLDSVDAVDPLGDAGRFRYWMWDSPCEVWLSGEQAEFRIIAAAADVGGLERAVAPSGLRASVAGGAVRLVWDASPVVAPLRGDAAVVYAVWRERVDESDSGGVGDEPVHDSIADASFADSDVAAGSTYRYAVSVANEGYDNSSVPGEPVTVEVPELLGDADPGVARFTVGDADPVDIASAGRRHDVAVDSAGGSAMVAVEANAFDARLSARSFRADQRTVRDHDLGAPVQLSGVGDTLLIVYARSDDGTQEQAYTLRLRPPDTAANVPNVPKGGSVPQGGIVPKAGSVPPVGVGSVSGWLRGPGSGLGARAVSDPSLSALTLSSGTLAPVFASGTPEYTAQVTSATSQVTVTPTAAAGTTAVVAAPDADPATSGHQVDLNASTADSSAQTAVVIVVWNSAGRLDSYTLTVTRAATSTGDTTLSALTVSGLTLVPAFDPVATEYTATAAADTATVTVTATAATATAAAVVKPDDAVSGTAGDQVNLTADDDTVITVTVTAQDSTTRDYTVTVTRPPTVLSSDATLASLDITDVDLAPDFGTASFPEITFELPDGCTLHDLGAGNETTWRDWDDACTSLHTSPDQRAAQYYRLYVGTESLIWLKVDGNSTSRLIIRSATGGVIAFDKSFYWEGRFEDEDAELVRTLRRGVYIVEVAAEEDFSGTRGHRLRYEGSGIIRPLEHQSAGADITGLVSASDIYTASVEHDTASVTVSAAATHAGARVEVSPADADPETPEHEIAVAAPAPGEDSARTIAAVAVTAEDGTRSTYIVVISRPAGAPTTQVTMELPQGCVFHELGAGNCTQWRRWDDNCDSLHNTTRKRAAQYYRLYVREDSVVWLKVDGNSSSRLIVRSAGGDIVAVDQFGRAPQYYDAELVKTLPRGVYVVEVAAEYYHHGFRGHGLEFRGDGIIAPYAYRLDDLAISDVGFDSFDPGTTTYARNVAADVSTVTVTPTPAFAYSTVQISPNDSDPDADGHQVGLETDGGTDIEVTVYSPEFPTLTTTYTVTLNQLAGTTSPLSDDATLSALSLSDIDIGTFAADDYSYSYTLGFYQSLNGHTTTVSPTGTHTGATWTIGPSASGIDSNQVTVNGDETVTVTVTSQNGDIRRTYTVSPGPPASRPDPSNNVCTPCGFDPSGNRDLWVDGDRITVGLELVRRSNVPNSFAVFDMNTGQRVETFTVPSAQYSNGWELHNFSFTTDGETLWISYGLKGSTIRAFDLATKERLPAKDLPFGFASIWTDGTTLYVNNSGWVSGYDIATKQHRSTIKLEGSWHNVRSSIWSDGTTLWLTEDNSASIRAYELKTGARTPGLDLRTGIAHGMWSNGAQVWVLGEHDNIHGYTLPENARLKQLSVDVGDIGLFNNGIFGYEATVPAGTTEVTVTAEAAFTGSIVAFDTTDADAVTDGHQVSISAASTVVTVTVTAPNGSDTETYTVTITRAS